jgi:hypothetical protein
MVTKECDEMDTPENEATNIRGNNEALTGRERGLANLRPFQAGNPGRPKGSKNKFSEDFWRALANDFAEHGVSAIERVRSEEPAKYLAACVNVLPKDLNVKHEATDAFVNLWKLISDGTAEQAIAKARGEDSSEAVH